LAAVFRRIFRHWTEVASKPFQNFSGGQKRVLSPIIGHAITGLVKAVAFQLTGDHGRLHMQDAYDPADLVRAIFDVL
ncbi:MAG: hypothetical protein ABR986_01080, partial [Methanomassiliicoccales archaeon]